MKLGQKVRTKVQLIELEFHENMFSADNILGFPLHLSLNLTCMDLNYEVLAT